MFMKTYFIRTYGCQQNIRDSEIIESCLNHLNFQRVDSWHQADLFILNSCSVRQASEDKIYGIGKEVLKLRNKGSDIKVIVMGCLIGSAVGERKRFHYHKLQQKLFWVDYLLKNDELLHLPEILFQLNLLENPDSQIDPSFSRVQSQSQHAYVNISTGCDNFCSYCVVPYARGKEISRPEKEILQEIETLISKGVTEITLLGQNVNSWNLPYDLKFQIRSGSAKKLPFASLLGQIHAYPQITKISFLSSNPFDFTEDLIDVLALPKIDRYLHIAVQSGDDEVLQKMNRRHTHKEFLNLISKLRDKIPEIQIGTDLIVGFPGESKEAFENTVKLCQEVRFVKAYVSMYSPRFGTAAAKMRDDVSKEEKKRRYQKLVRVIAESRKD